MTIRVCGLAHDRDPIFFDDGIDGIRKTVRLEQRLHGLENSVKRRELIAVLAVLSFDAARLHDGRTFRLERRHGGVVSLLRGLSFQLSTHSQEPFHRFDRHVLFDGLGDEHFGRCGLERRRLGRRNDRNRGGLFLVHTDAYGELNYSSSISCSLAMSNGSQEPPSGKSADGSESWCIGYRKRL